MRKILYLFSFFMLTTAITYSHYLYENFDILLEEADYIFIGKVLNGKIVENTPAEYEIKILEPLKGCKKDEIIINHGYYGLRIGMDYLFLLKRNSNNIFEDFFEGMNKFDVVYEQYNGEFDYCIKVPLAIIRMDDELVGEKHNQERNIWNDHLYKIEDIKKYIKKKINI